MIFETAHRITTCESETRALGAKIAASIPDNGLIAISGDLGSGKTVLVRGICEHEGCANQTSSPTFTLINEYSGFRTIYHIDLYRLSSLQEMLDLGLAEILKKDALVVVEWAERALPLLPLPRIEISARHGSDEHTREFSIQYCRRGAATILSAPVELLIQQS